MSEPDVKARASKKYVRTFIFSMRTGTSIEKLHVITKFFMIVAISILTLYMFDIPVSRGGPDFIGLVLLLVLVFSLLAISKTAKYSSEFLPDTFYTCYFSPVLLVAFLQRIASGSQNDVLPMAGILSHRSFNAGIHRGFCCGLL